MADCLEVTVSTIQLNHRQKPAVILGVYRPPNAKIAWFQAFNELLIEIGKYGSIVILGDLNADLLKPNLYPGKELLNSLSLANTEVAKGNPTPTRITAYSSTCLDIIAIDKDLTCLDYQILNIATSDHFPVFASIESTNANKLIPIVKRSFAKVDMIQLSEACKSIVLIEDSSSLPASSESLLATWYHKLSEVLDTFAPLKSHPTRKKKSPWLNNHIKNLIGRRDWLARQLQQFKDSPNTDSKTMVTEELKVAKKQVKSNIRRRIKTLGEEALSESNHRKAWSFIKAATCQIKKSKESHHELEGFNDYFAECVTKASDRSPGPIHGCNNNDSFTFSHFSVHETERLLKSTKSDTATGCDEIPGFLLKQLSSALAPNLTIIFNTSLSEGVVPSQWKKSNVCAVWKGKGSKKDPSNFRPISIIPVAARMFEKAVASQLYQFCDTRQIIPPEQFGFRRNSNCEAALLSAANRWMESVDAGDYVGALAIDLSKAFDTVPHHLLLQELMQIGCGIDVVTWFCSYLSEREQRVTQRPNTTSWKPVTRGVPQGSCLSPLLFNIYVRKIPQISTTASSSSTVQFADDITNSDADKNLDTVKENLTANFNAISGFCDMHGLKINAAKTQLVMFKSPGRKIPDDFELLLNGCSIKPIKSMKILGCTLDMHFTFAPHIDNVVNKCHGLIGALSRAVPFLPRSLLCTAYTSLIRTHLEYSSALLSAASKTHLAKFDTIQRIAARVIFNVPRDAHSEPLLNALNLQPLSERRNEHIIQLIQSFVSRQCHPAFWNFFEMLPDGTIKINSSSRLRIGEKRFSVLGARIFNNRKI